MITICGKCGELRCVCKPVELARPVLGVHWYSVQYLDRNGNVVDPSPLRTELTERERELLRQMKPYKSHMAVNP